MDAKLEELSEVRGGLVSQYKEEKEKQLTDNLKTDYVKEREAENVSIFKIENIGNYVEKSNLSVPQNRSENEEWEEKVSFQKRR